VLGLVGASQTLSQFAFSWLRPNDDRKIVLWLEQVELIGILMMFVPASASLSAAGAVGASAGAAGAVSMRIQLWRALFILG
jgi:hypothetical protein